MEKITKQIEIMFPSFLVDARKELATGEMTITVFNANRYSNTHDPQRETYVLSQFGSTEELLAKIKQDFTHEK